MREPEAPARSDPTPENRGDLAPGETPAPGESASSRRSRWIALLVTASTIALAVRLLLFVDRYAIDVLNWDQWDLWNGLFEGAGPWALFRQQHAAHRLGLGGLVLGATAHLSHWNTRAESFVAAALLVLATAAALALVRLLRGRWAWTDVAVPVLVLTVQQYEASVITPVLASGALPPLLIFSFALALRVRRERLRLALLVVVGALATHTGYTMFLGWVAPFIVLLLTIRAARARSGLGVHVLGLGVSVAAVALFFHGYVFQPGCPFPDPEPSRYAAFLGDAFVRTFEVGGRPTVRIAGLGLAAACAGLAGWSAWRTTRTLAPEPAPAAVFVLTSFSLLFIGSAAVGRACIPDGGSPARYVPCVLPFLLAAYLLLSGGPRVGRARTALLAAFVGVLLYKELVLTRRVSEPHARANARRKWLWRDCYVQTSSPLWCNSREGVAVHPDPVATRMVEKLAFMKERSLSFFRSYPGGVPPIPRELEPEPER